MQLADKLIGFCEDWEEFLEEAEVKYHSVWRKLTFYLSDQDQPMLKTLKLIDMR